MASNKISVSAVGALAARGAESPNLFSRLRPYAATVRNFIFALPGWYRYRLTQPLTIVVLGMHRSGTSCITRMINLCGASVGEVIPGNHWNQEGHWEAREGLDINEYIFRISGGAWDRPPEAVRTDSRVRWRMRRFLGRLHRQGTAVWKDPRTVLTFPLWKPMLCKYLIVAVFRHPMSVARSLKRRDGLDLQTGLDLWRRYNERLLEIAKLEKNVQWMEFGQDPAQLYQRIELIAEKAALPFNPEIAHAYEQELRTCDSQEQSDDVRIASLYGQLKALCAGNNVVESSLVSLP